MNLMNCHAEGLDSIVLSDRVSTNRGLIRVFVARPEHSLWRNHPEPRPHGEVLPVSMSIGMRSHHCDITMVPLFGDVFNVVETSEHHAMGRRILSPFMFDSAITGRGSFTKGRDAHWRFDLKTMRLIKTLALPANVRHSVFVPKGQAAAWMIVEGAEDPGYVPLTWSDADLTRMNFGGLYQRMTQARLDENLTLLHVHGFDTPQIMDPEVICA
jgi:hypothetical protein